MNLENVTQAMIVIIFSTIVFVFYVRENEIQLRSFFKTRYEVSELSKIVSYMDQQPDAVLIANMTEVLHINQKFCQIFQINK